MHTVKITEQNKKLIQVGTKLKRIKNNTQDCRVGKIYTVCTKRNDHSFLIKDDRNCKMGIDLENFELVVNKTYGLWI